MNPEVKKLWVAALLSGQYTQTKGQLRKVANPWKVHQGSSFCCLGVLCNLHAQAHPEIAAREPHIERYMGEAQLLPRVVADWAGLVRVNGTMVVIDGSRDTLSGHNDTDKSFDKIAAAIEAQL